MHMQAGDFEVLMRMVDETGRYDTEEERSRRRWYVLESLRGLTCSPGLRTWKCGSFTVCSRSRKTLTGHPIQRPLMGQGVHRLLRDHWHCKITSESATY